MGTSFLYVSIIQRTEAAYIKNTLQVRYKRIIAFYDQKDDLISCLIDYMVTNRFVDTIRTFISTDNWISDSVILTRIFVLIDTAHFDREVINKL